MSRNALEGKTRLPGRVQDAINDSAAICTQIIKGSKSSEVLNTAIKNFALQEAAVENSHANLKRMTDAVAQLKVQAVNVEKSIEVISEIQDQLAYMERKRYFSTSTDPDTTGHLSS